MKRIIGPAMLVIAFLAIGLTGFATLAGAQTVSGNLPHYTVINLGILTGGSTSNASGVTNNGWVNGDSWLAGNQNEHAVLWRPDAMGQFKITDLGTLGGLNSASAWPSSSKNNRGLVVGQAQGAKVDPLGEYWAVDIGCGTSNGLCMGWQNLEFGFVWQNGVMTKLPPLGGYNSIANGVNNLGQVVGWAETATKDSSCVPPQQYDINAAVWERGEVRALPPFPGDVLSAAIGINDNGDVVGGSGTCGIIVSGALSVHAVVWRNGLVFNLPGLGGVMNNAALAINNVGQIVGESDPQGDATTYAVLWQNGAMTNLGTLPGDFMSVAYDINAQGQVVGSSCAADFNCRAVLWDHGVIMDLNSLIPSDSPLYLYFGSGINDQGEISGYAFLKSNPNEQPGFLAIPAPAAQIAGDSAQKMILPDNIRASLQRRLRLGRPTTQQ
jgi:probable HAF family extracellular repeat protein